MIYLDYSATTPPDERVLKVYWKAFGIILPIPMPPMTAR